MKKTRLNGHVYDFGVDYDAIAVDYILSIQKYLMKKNNTIQKCLDLLKKHFIILSSVNPLNAIPFSAALLNAT